MTGDREMTAGEAVLAKFRRQQAEQAEVEGEDESPRAEKASPESDAGSKPAAGVEETSPETAPDPPAGAEDDDAEVWSTPADAAGELSGAEVSTPARSTPSALARSSSAASPDLPRSEDPLSAHRPGARAPLLGLAGALVVLTVVIVFVKRN